MTEKTRTLKTSVLGQAVILAIISIRKSIDRSIIFWQCNWIKMFFLVPLSKIENLGNKMELQLDHSGMHWRNNFLVLPRLEPEEKRNWNLNPHANLCFLNGNKLWNLISYFRCIDVLVPDIPESLDIKIKRERYLAKEALQDADQILQKVLTDHESDRVDSGMILTI